MNDRSRSWSHLLRIHQPKPDMVSPEPAFLKLTRGGAISCAIIGGAEIGPAFYDVNQFASVGARSAGARPFPHITDHIIQTKSVWLETAHRRATDITIGVQVFDREGTLIIICLWSALCINRLRQSRRAAACVASVPAKGLDQPSMLGAKPPVTISPVPPAARSAKYAASFGKSALRSSSPVCIEPINTRLRRVVKPKSRGRNRCGYGEGSFIAQAY